jgi:hypothetical protein
LLVVFDAAKFLIVGGATIINWRSFIHPFWVILAAGLYFVGARVNKKWFWNALLALYSTIFILALVNQYVPFTEVLSYNCMLFNLMFVPLYLFLGSDGL